MLGEEKENIYITKMRRSKKLRYRSFFLLWMSVICLCLLSFARIATADAIVPNYETATTAGTSPSHAWTIPGQNQVINHQGGFGTEGWDQTKSWDGDPNNVDKSYLKFGTDQNNPDFQIRQFAKQTTTPGLFDVFLNVKGNKVSQVKPIDIVLVVDMSGSMNAFVNGGMDRVSAVRNGVKNFLSAINDAGAGSYVNVGLVGFSGQENANKSGIQTENIDRISNASHVNQINRILDQNFSGATFTQKGIREGQRMLLNDQSEHKKLMILLTDGVPTQAYKVTQAQKKDGQVMGTAFSQEWDYPGISSQLWQFNGTPPSWQQRSPMSYSIDGQEIRDTWAATLGEAYLIRNTGTKLHTLGIQLGKDDGYTDNHSDTYLTETQVRNRMALMASPGQYQDANSVADVETYLKNQVKDVLSEFYTVKNGTINNPIGKQFIYADGQPEVKSVGQKAIDQLPNVTQDAQQLTVKGITLSKNQEIQIHYQVHLNTESQAFKPNYWYQVSGQPTFSPTEKSPPVAFGVPSARALGTQLQVTKKWAEVDDASQRPDHIEFTVGRTIAEQRTDWRATGILAASDSWEKGFDQVTQAGQSVWLPAYNNQGQPFNYQVLSEQTSGYHTQITNKTNEALLVNCQYGLIIDKLAKGTKIPIAGAAFTVTSSDGQRVLTVKAGQRQRLIPGEYLIKESQPPLGFQQDNTVYHLTLTADGRWLQDDHPIQDTSPGIDGEGLKDGFSIAKALSSNPNQTNIVRLTRNNEVKQFNLLVKKTDEQTERALPGAQFILKTTSGVNVVPVVNHDTSQFTFANLAPGTYTLSEQQAPKGYIRAEPVVMTITRDGLVQITSGSKQWDSTLTAGQDNNQLTLRVPNRHQTVFPATGSSGHQPFVIVASVLFVIGLLLSLYQRHSQRRRPKT